MTFDLSVVAAVQVNAALSDHTILGRFDDRKLDAVVLKRIGQLIDEAVCRIGKLTEAGREPTNVPLQLSRCV